MTEKGFARFRSTCHFLQHSIKHSYTFRQGIVLLKCIKVHLMDIKSNINTKNLRWNKTCIILLVLRIKQLSNDLHKKLQALSLRIQTSKLLNIYAIATFKTSPPHIVPIYIKLEAASSNGIIVWYRAVRRAGLFGPRFGVRFVEMFPACTQLFHKIQGNDCFLSWRTFVVLTAMTSVSEVIVIFFRLF